MTSAHPPGQIVTFYSYKGGTGRSMALANVAWILAANGARVLVIDWDLEAPGLHRYFRPFLTDPDLTETKGLIDAFWDMTAVQVARANGRRSDRVLETASAGPGGGTMARVASEEPEPPHLGPLLLSVTRRLRHKLTVARKVSLASSKDDGEDDDKLFLGDGYIDFIGAGRQGGAYSERVNTFDWRGFYELGGAAMLSEATEVLRTKYDWVLIDSRTGVSDTSGICTMQMPDKVVAFFTLNRQSTEGVTSVLASIRAWRADHPKLPPITFFPVATRIENAEKDKLDAARLHCRSVLQSYLPEGTRDQESYWNQMEVAYRPWYSYEEVIAPFGDQTGPARTRDSMLAQMEIIAQTISGSPRQLRSPDVSAAERSEVLSQFSFDGGKPSTAVTRPAVRELEPLMKGLLRKRALWENSGKHYRLLLSRNEMAYLSGRATVSETPEISDYVKNSEKIHEILKRNRRWMPRAITITLYVMVPLATARLFYLPFGFTADTLVKDILVRIGASLDSLISTESVVLVGTAWVLVGFLEGAWGSRQGAFPDGMTFVQSLQLSMRGPFQPEIRDYSILDEPGGAR